MRYAGRGIAVLVILLVLYVVSYLALLNPISALEGNATRVNYQRIIHFHIFQFSSELELVYQPLIALDQKIRPEYWLWTETAPFRKLSEP
jgi:hypothetical protein